MALKIALVSLYVFENNGVRFLASVLRQAGFQVYEIYFKDYLHHRYIPPSDEEIARFRQVITENEIGLAGVSIRAGAYLEAGKQLTDILRKDMNIPVIWGGAHISFDREKCVADCDYLAVGEAEDSIVELARAIESGGDTQHIPGIWANNDGEIIKNPVRDLVQDLDRIPFRDYHSHEYKYVIDGKRFDKGDPVIGESIYLMLSSRGCQFDCKFCDVNILRRIYKGKGKFFRVRGVENLMAEIRYAQRHFKNMVRIRFDDELFPFNRKWLEEFAGRYKKEFSYPFEILSDPRVINDRDIRLLKEAGLDHVLLGVQATEKVNRELFGRNHSDDKVVEISRILSGNKIRASYQIILDIPKTTTEDSENMLDMLLRMSRPFDLLSFSLGLWPGTELTMRLLKEGVATEDQIAGRSKKALTQFRVDASMDRPATERFFIALFHLTSKSFVPKALIRWMSKNRTLRRHPWPVSLLSETANFIKLAWTACRMLRRRELTWNMVRRFFNLKAPVSI